MILTFPSLHPSQIEMASAQKRFNYAVTGRRWGKTSFLEYGASMQALKPNKRIGLFYPYPDFYREVWHNIINILEPLIASTHGTEHVINLKNGSQIDFWSTHKESKGRGFKYNHVWVDEAQSHKQLLYSLNNVIHPTLADFSGNMWVLGTANGYDEFHSLFDSNLPNNAFFRYTTYDNPYVATSEIDLAKERLPELVFRQEYLAEFVTLSSVFAYEFNEDKHVCVADFNPEERLYISFDFNLEPITAIVAQSDGETIKIIDEFRIMNGTIYLICEAIKQRYGDYLFDCEITGDPAGHARQLTGKNPVAYYYLIKEQLNLNNLQMKAPKAQFGHKNSRLLLNSVFYSKPITISPNCRHLIADLKYVQAGEDGSIKKEGSATKHFTHLLDCLINYLYTYHHKHIIK